MTVEVRKVTTATLEGASPDHTPYEYQLGATVGGVFVPFVTKAGGYIDALVANGTPEPTPTPAPEATPTPDAGGTDGGA